MYRDSIGLQSKRTKNEIDSIDFRWSPRIPYVHDMYDENEQTSLRLFRSNSILKFAVSDIESLKLKKKLLKWFNVHFHHNNAIQPENSVSFSWILFDHDLLIIICGTYLDFAKSNLDHGLPEHLAQSYPQHTLTHTRSEQFGIKIYFVYLFCLFVDFSTTRSMMNHCIALPKCS